MTILQSAIAQAAAGGGYQIARSLRFNSADSAYLNRTPASNGNRRTWTFSAWVKRSSLGALQALLSAPYSTNSDAIRFEAADTLIIFSNDGTNANLTTTQVFRDVSSWYHIVVAVDTPQATSTNRIKLYVNGTQVTVFGTATYPTQNYDFNINANVAQNIGRNSLTASQYLGGYMTEINFIDGQALTPSSFGETSATTGVWNPIDYTGTYGTNGFYLNFSDNSNTTAATLGADTSGNGNNWTPNNFSVTAGAGNDSLVDTPTNYGTDTGIGGEVRGNYCTLNPLDKGSDVNTVVNGNLNATWINANGHSIRSTMSVSSGKWYWEFTNVNNLSCGVIQQQLKIVPASGALWPGSDGFGVGGSFAYRSDTGQKVTNSVSSTYGASYTTTDVIGCALDMDNGKIWWSKNGTWQASGDPAAGTNEAYSGLSGNFSPAWGYINPGNDTLTANFGQRAFSYTAPSGFKALCTQNLPTPAIGATSSTLASKNFNAVAWSGTDGSDRTITGVGFQPDLVWAKSRSDAYSHTLFDAVRGAGSNKELMSDSTGTEGSTGSTATNGFVSGFTSDGFSTDNGSANTSLYFNAAGKTYVAWNWKGGNGTVSNTSGSITSTVSANATAGISIVGYTGTGANATVGHGLGVAPKMVILKSRSAVKDWVVGNNNYTSWAYIQKLNDTIAQTSVTDIFNSTAPTSSVFSLGGNLTSNTSGATYIAYCFAEVAGFSKFGKYTGNGSTDGPFVYCGFRPRYVMVKRLNTVSNWQTFDGVRDPYNVVDIRLQPNTTNADASGGTSALDFADFLSNGFKLRGTDTDWNASGSDYIFMAFAEAPFNYARAR